MRKVNTIDGAFITDDLQWGRNMRVAERRHGVAELLELLPSMGPQHESCGKSHGKDHACR